jgi:aspartate/methionine/tyrosine aminotransferase
MLWAKAQLEAPARYNLAASGMTPPDRAALGLDLDALDLDHRAPDMPAEPRRRLAARFGVGEARILLTLGTSHAMFLACASALRPGERCLVERPAYEMLPRLPELLGARVGRIDRRLETGWRLPPDLPARIRRERPRMVLVSNPHNPSGAVLPLEELEPVARAVTAVRGWLLVDEVYLEYLPDAPARSAARLGGNVAVASSLTKALGLGTARFGWLIAPEEQIEAAVRYNDYVSVLYPAPSAWIGLAALERLGALRARALETRAQNLPLLARFVEDHAARLSWAPPAATVMAFVRLRGARDTLAFVERLRRDHHTLVVPGRFFEAPGFVRIGFGIPTPKLRAGLARLARALARPHR